MIAARTARTARRSLMDGLFLDGMDWTNANPWFGAIGLLVTLVVGCCLDGWLL